MRRGAVYLTIICVSLLLASTLAVRKLPGYHGAVVGETVHLGFVSKLLGSARTYSKSDCHAQFLDQKAAGDSSLEVRDSNNGAEASTFLVGTFKTATGDLAYELKCGEEYGVGSITVSPAKSILVSPEANVYLDLTQDQAAKDQFVFVHGVEGNNLAVQLEGKDTSNYFEATFGGLSNLVLYEKSDDGSVAPIKVPGFSKILQIREWNSNKEGVLQDSDLASTLALVSSDETTISYFDLESSKDKGRVYVHAGNKQIAAGKGYALSHCFPVIKNGQTTNFYCVFQVGAKAKGPIVYYDILSTEDELVRKEFSGVSSILAVSPMQNGRTAFLALDDKQERKILSFDASSGFERTKENEDTYFSGKVIKISLNDEECTLNINGIQPADFRFGEASVFVCKASQVLATFDLDNSFDAPNPSPVQLRSFQIIDTKVDVPLCASDEEFITLEDRNTTLVFRGGKNSPGSEIRYPLGIESSAVHNVHCGGDSALVFFASKKKSYLLDINRGSKRDSITRVNSIEDISSRPATMEVTSSHSVVFYEFNKKRAETTLSQYNGFLGLVRITSKSDTNAGDHTLKVVVTDGTQRKEFAFKTSIEAEEKFSVAKNKPLEGFVPGKEYYLRDYLTIEGQVSSVAVVKPETTRNIFWHADEVVFVNSQNGTSKGSKFTIGDYFVDLETVSYVNKDGATKKLDSTVLPEARYLGVLQLEMPVAMIAVRADSRLSVQALFIGANGEIQVSKVVKLVEEVDSDFAHRPHLATVNGKPSVVFFKSSEDDEDKGIAVEYKFDKAQASFLFVNQDNQKVVDWSSSGSIGGYNIKPVESDETSNLSSCVQFKVSGESLPASKHYYICGVTGGSSERVEFTNIRRESDGSVKFYLINYPSSKTSRAISWWEITSNLLGQDGTPVAPSQFTPTTKLVRKFNGLKNHKVKKVFNLGNFAVALSEVEEKGIKNLYESYFGTRGSKPYYIRKINDVSSHLSDYDLHFSVVRGVAKRIYTNFARNFNNVADLQFKDARVRLSKHLATVHVINPFTLQFNNEVKIQDLAVKLDKHYDDDGKTDEDDEKTDPEDDPSKPFKRRKSRLWLILGILALILVVGAVDLFLRRRSAYAEAESKLDHENPKVVKKKHGADVKDELKASLTEM